MEIRQISADQRPEMMFPLQAYAFDTSPAADEALDRYRQRMRFYGTAVNLVAVEDDASLACVSAFPMEQNVRGRVLPMAGVASVASHPLARRRGFVRQLLDQLLRDMRDRGSVVSTLYPFRPSFYGRFGFVGLPRPRQASFSPDGLSHLIRAELPGTVDRLPMADGFAEFDAFTRRLLTVQHGFSVYDDMRTAEFRDDKVWVALARADGEVVGALRYRIERFGGDFRGEDFLVSGPLGRALLLQFFARHADQAGRVVLRLSADEVPDLWGTDMAVLTEGRVAYPSNAGPMGRILDLPGLTGIRAGDGAVTVEILDDEFLGGTYRLTGSGGKLTVETAQGASPGARVTAAGISGLVYGVLDPVDVVVRGFGEVDAAAVEPLRTMFPREMPYLFADF